MATKLYNHQMRINYYTLCMNTVVCPQIKKYYKNLIAAELKESRRLVIRSTFTNEYREPRREFTLEELSKYNGENGKPAYVAVNGTVYDLSLAPSWGGGTHFGLYAGKDLSSEFNSCHKGIMSILTSLPRVGALIKEKII
uniref:HypQ3 n=1 Tax=Clostridium acetobutylicum TaxID=1488 RepID=Q9AMN3_CLOAT|nr:HypQ3 [Clostridium acetobutylicum ATCC 824]